MRTSYKNEIRGLMARRAFEYVNRNQLPHDVNILGGIFTLTIKQPQTEDELYKARFIVHVHKDKENEYIINI